MAVLRFGLMTYVTAVKIVLLISSFHVYVQTEGVSTIAVSNPTFYFAKGLVG